MVLGTVTKSGTTLTYDMSPRTGRKDLALAFSRFGVTRQNDSSLPPGGHIYISNWLYVTKNNNYIFTHNLNSDDILIMLEFKNTLNAASCIPNSAYGYYSGTTFYRTGITVRKTSPNEITVTTAMDTLERDLVVGGHVNYDSGYLRIIALKIT